jgi:hypothetical protein
MLYSMLYSMMYYLRMMFLSVDLVMVLVSDIYRDFLLNTSMTLQR